MQVGNFIRAAAFKLGIGFRQGPECVRCSDKSEPHSLGRLVKKTGKISRRHRHRSTTTAQQATQLRHICRMSAKIDCGGQRHRHQTGILAGKKETQEVGIGIRYHGNPRATLQTEREQAPGKRQCLLAKLAIRQHCNKFPAAGIEVRASFALRRVIQCLSQRGKICAAQK